jgi:hypothetical protein
MSLFAIITGPIVQGFVASASRSKNLGLEFPSAALSSRVALPVDAIITEAFAKTTEPTNSPVEDGSDVSDHVVLKPDKLTLECVVSDTPVSLLAALGSFASRGKTSPVLDCITFLNALVESRQLFDFVGSMQYYKGYVMTSWVPIKNSKLGSSIEFTCQMQKLRIVNSSIVLNANLNPSKKLTGGSKTSLGTQSTTPATPKQDLLVGRWGGTFQSVSPTAATASVGP